MLFLVPQLIKSLLSITHDERAKKRFIAHHTSFSHMEFLERVSA